MMLISYMIQHYFGIPYQAFTEKAITAYALLKAVDGTSEEDIDRIKWIQENTNKNIMVSLWKLDRSVNPSKGQFNIAVQKRRFIRNDSTNIEEEQGVNTIELNEDTIQHYLCEAINEIHDVVVRNIKGYKEEMKIGDYMKADEVKANEFSAVAGFD